MVDDSGTWHYGLVANWWAEFNIAEPNEVAYFRAAIERFGEPALDLGCGTGRILLPMLAAGLDVDGSDISPDMVAHARAAARARGFAPGLSAQPIHELDLERTYRTIFLCGVFGIGGRRDHDREALRRIRRHLEPGGAVLIAHELPYADGGTSEERWARWLPGHRPGIPLNWPTEGDRRRTADGDEIELINRTFEFDPLEQRRTLEIRARLWRGGVIVAEEEHRLAENLYFAQEIVLLLDEAGFRDVRVEGGYTGRPATPDDGSVVFVGRG
ncbi:MAG: methyltransferase domain-containing protein [Chloroflexota bacterium]